MSSVDQIAQISIRRIRQKENARGTYKDHEIASLMASLKQIGQLQPIGVRALSREEFEVVYGNRRLVAARKLGWETIGCVMVAPETKADFFALNVSENIHRADVPLPELGRICHELSKEGLTVSEIASRFSCSNAKISNALQAFREIPKKYQDKIAHGAGLRGGAKKGRIPAALATQVLSITKSLEIPKEDTAKLFDLASEDGVTGETIMAVGKLMGQGYPINKAVESSRDLEVVKLHITLHKSEVERIESKHQCGINKFLYDIIAADGRVNPVRLGWEKRVIVRKNKQLRNSAQKNDPSKPPARRG